MITFAPASRSWLSVGRDALIRPSSVILPSANGTFMSQRTTTRLPCRSPRSATDFTMPPSTAVRVHEIERTPGSRSPACGSRADPIEEIEDRPGSGAVSEGLADQTDEVDQTVGVAPLVVVPADDLDQVTRHLGERSIEDAGGRVGDDVGRHQRRLAVLQVALERTLGGGLHGGVDLLGRRLATGLEGQVG